MLWHLVHHFQILGRDFNPWSLLKQRIYGRTVLIKQMILRRKYYNGSVVPISESINYFENIWNPWGGYNYHLCLPKR